MPTVEQRSILEIAEAIAPGWERQRARVEDTATPVHGWLVRELAPRPGETVLELAAGAGDTGFEAAKAVGDRGRLICTDLSPSMVDVARRRCAELGLGNVDFRTLDAQVMDLDDDVADGVICRFGFMLMPDRDAAFAETRRVLRRGGRLALAVWGAPERNPFVSVVATLLIAQGHLAPPDRSAPSPFSLGDPANLRAALEIAGFDVARVDEVPVRFRFTGLDDYVTFVAETSGPVGLVVRELSGSDLVDLRTSLAVALAPFATRGGAYVLPGVALAASAR